ncbi:SAM-dependent methyltransferase [Actinoplanes sp. NPDC051851]|uniref:SAM-dependent methyltransferase n=1 Tax=Actinoplanes sp. NPDC051851 TaxID=3154753 RepID=UPI00343F7CD6
MPGSQIAGDPSTGNHDRPPIDTTRPNIARLYDYLLGGKDNFEADRLLGDRIKTAMPAVCLGVEQQRDALRRVVRYLVAEAGIRQIIDVGSGLPTAGNVHQIAQEIAPETRVVYVDNDPVVLAHSRALMAGNRETLTVEGDFRRPAELLAHPELTRHVDLSRPVALLLCGIVHHITDDEDPATSLAAYRAALPAGSYVFIHHLLATDDPTVAAAQAELQQGTGRGQFRPLDQIASYFDGLELIEPGIVTASEWRPEPGTPRAADHPVLRLAAVGVGHKP